MATNPNFSVNKDATLEDVNAVNLNVAGAVVGGGLNVANSGFNTAVGYAPATFGTTAQNAVVSLNRAPGLAADAAVTVATANANTLILPARAVVTRAFASNNGTAIAGGTTFNIGTNATAAAAQNIFAAVTSANLIVGASVGGGQGTAVAAMNFDAVGEGLDTVAVFATSGGVGITAAAAFVTATVLGANNTAGDLKVALEYLVM